MNSELIKKIDALIDDARSEVAKTTIELVNIKSVEEAPLPGAPFGAGPRKVLDRVMEMGADAGFYNVDYNVGVISIAMKDSEPDLGIWIHGDVVPEGVGWTYDPYDAVEYKGCIIGRGATDNKGQFAAVYHLFKIFKELNIELKYNPAIYVGSNEESGMKDMLGIPGNDDAKGFLNVCTPPKVSWVPDSGFPVGYGGKGRVVLLLKSKKPLENLTFIAGQDEAPGKATAVFPAQEAFPEALPECNIEYQSDGSIVVTADSPPVHGTKPDPAGNMITKLAGAVSDCCAVNEDEKSILEFLRRTSKDAYGQHFGIKTENEVMGKLTVLSKTVYCEEGYVTLLLDIRYPINITYSQIVDNVTAEAEKCGFEMAEVRRGADAYITDPSHEITQLLYKVSKDFTGDPKEPYIVQGNAYGHYLPNSYAFGMDGNLPPEDFPKGRGNAHGIDEAVSLDRLQRAMKIYARAMLAMNDIEW